MQISRDFTIAVHTLLCIEYFSGKYKVTSDFIASSVGVNPVIIRRMLLKLKECGMIEVKQGTGGAHLVKTPKDISFYDIYCAAGCDQKPIFNFHENPNPKCPVGKNIHTVLDSRLCGLQKSLEDTMKTMNLGEVIECLDSRLEKR